jgi:hypothetical protein
MIVKYQATSYYIFKGKLFQKLYKSQLIKMQEPEYLFLGNWGMLNPNITAIFLSHL